MIEVRPVSLAIADAVLAEPWIASKIGHDDRRAGPIDHPAVSYWGGFVDNRIAGVFTAARVTGSDMEVHAALFRWATRHGRDLGRLFLAQMFADPRLLRVSAPVLASLPGAVNYCRKLGFEIEGVKPDACYQNFCPVAVINLGLRRSNWEAA